MTEADKKVLAEASAAFAEEDFERSVQLFERLKGVPKFESWSLFYLGRIAQHRADLDMARSYFRKALTGNPEFFWCYFELLSTLLNLGAPEDEVRETVCGMVASNFPQKLTQKHLSGIENIAHRVFDRIDRSLGVQLLELVHRSAGGYQISELGLVRIVEEGTEAELRKRIARTLEKRENLSEISQTILKTFRETEPSVAKDKGDAESSPVQEVPDGLPTSFGDCLTAVKAAIARSDKSLVDRLQNNIERFPYRQQLFFNVVVQIEQDCALLAASLWYEYTRLYSEAPKFPGIRIVYMLLDAFDIEMAELILALLWANYPEDTDIALTTVVLLLRRNNYEEADALYIKFLDGLPEKNDAMLCTRCEILMARGKLKEAEVILRPLFESNTASSGAVKMMIRIAAEQQRWEYVYTLGASKLTGHESFPGHLEPLVRAARATDQVRQLYDALSAIDLEAHPGHAFAQQALFEDLVVAGKITDLEIGFDLAMPDHRQTRIAAWRNLLRKPEFPAGRNRIYYCADKAYLEPALTSLVSLVISNMSLARRIGLSLIVEADLISQAEFGVLPIRRELGIDIEVVNAATILPDPSKLRTKYGMTTGGHNLSVAAYYRIFFAKKLASEGNVDQAIYIDADTLVRPGLSSIFSDELNAPLSARVEVSRPEINHAAKTHGLKSPYFNSGVLRFDFRHSETEACLDEAIRVAIDTDVKLFFHDQCALNIGFDGRAGQLSAMFNYFITPDKTFSDESTESVILHYLDRPKPWDSLYRRNADEWFRWSRIRHNLSSSIEVAKTTAKK